MNSGGMMDLRSYVNFVTQDAAFVSGSREPSRDETASHSKIPHMSHL